MSNPFDDDEGTFHVLVNSRGEHSLWPDFAADPAGWTIVVNSVPRQEALAYVETHWLDLQPDRLGGRVGAGEPSAST